MYGFHFALKLLERFKDRKYAKSQQVRFLYGFYFTHDEIRIPTALCLSARRNSTGISPIQQSSVNRIAARLTVGTYNRALCGLSLMRLDPVDHRYMTPDNQCWNSRLAELTPDSLCPGEKDIICL